MRRLLWELVCFFDGAHFPTRTPFIVGRAWKTRVRCWCGRMDFIVDGMIENPRSYP